MTQMRLPAVAPIDPGPAQQADPGISSIPADLSRTPRDMKKAGPEARSTGGLAGPYFGTPAGSVARGRTQCLWRATQGIFQGHHMTRLDGKREEPRFDPTVMMTFLVGLVAAVFLATTM
jgi:hypothetical protein